ncbi:hypothetical protein BDZ45DRAFT_745520 [Acephala macrosclerotiorum]|nr:hypothetical protein BDZ45DRAFT_745520 [Acephala macrosclerotiorum]
MGNFVPVFAPALTFITYAVQAKLRGLEPLTSQLAFTALALLSLLTGPATRLLFIVPTLASSLTCFERLQNFLLSPSWEDHWHVQTKIHDSRGSSDMAQESLSTQSPSIDLEPAILIENATLRPSSTAGPVLNNLDLRLEKSSITIIAGPIGSEKPTLLRTIIGELPFQGDILIFTPRIAYYDSYYYFNVNYSAALFTTPQGDTLYRPSSISQSQTNASYLIGVDFRTEVERRYWDDGTGKFVRTFRKYVKTGELEQLEKFKIRTLKIDNKEVVVDAIKMEKMREAREPRAELLRSPGKEPRRAEVSVVELKVEPSDY